MSTNIETVITGILSKTRKGTAFDVHEKLPEYMKEKIPVDELDRILTDMENVQCIGIVEFEFPKKDFRLGKKPRPEFLIDKNAREYETAKMYRKNLKEFLKDNWFKVIMKWDREDLGAPVGWHPESCKCYGCNGGDENKTILLFSPYKGICIRYIGRDGKKEWDVLYNSKDEILEDKYGIKLSKFSEDYGKKLSRPTIDELLNDFFEIKLKYFDKNREIFC